MKVWNKYYSVCRRGESAGAIPLPSASEPGPGRATRASGGARTAARTFNVRPSHLQIDTSTHEEGRAARKLVRVGAPLHPSQRVEGPALALDASTVASEDGRELRPKDFEVCSERFRAFGGHLRENKVGM